MRVQNPAAEIRDMRGNYSHASDVAEFLMGTSIRT